MDITPQTKAFVDAHRTEDVRDLALHARRTEGIDLPWAFDQIAGWQAARTKLPQWAACDGIVYPPHLSMEQCSSEATARYKARLASRFGGRRMVDLTGGFGVDFSYIAQGFAEATYVERQSALCEVAEHNARVLGLDQARIVNADAGDYAAGMEPVDVIMIDPARRDAHGGRTYAIADCTPDVLALAPILLAKSAATIVKLSPMLDWRKAVDDLNAAAGSDTAVAEVHIVSVDNECKELLLVLRGARRASPAGGNAADDGATVRAGDDDRDGVVIRDDAAIRDDDGDGVRDAVTAEDGDGVRDGAVMPDHDANRDGMVRDGGGVCDGAVMPGADGSRDGIVQDDDGVRDGGVMPGGDGSRDGMVRDARDAAPLRVCCVNLTARGEDRFDYVPSPADGATPIAQPDDLRPGSRLYEPNASIMKAGCFVALAGRYGVRQLAANSHLFVADGDVDGFPGRRFRIEAVSTMGKRELRAALAGADRANITVRNFPMTVAQLRRKLRLGDGGDVYLFATTTGDGRHVVIRTTKA